MVLKGELIGLPIKVVDSKNKANLGLEGRIIDETKHLIIISTKKGEKKIIKDQNKIKITIGKEKMIIDGSLLKKRPEDRIKAKVVR